MIDRIKALRKEKKWTQIDLAEYLGVSIDTVKKWESVKSQLRPGPENKPKLEKLFEKYGIE